MNHLIIDTDNFYSADINAYKYALTLEPISLIPVRNREAMNKQVIIRARRHGRGVIVTNDLAKAMDLVRRFGGYVYDMTTIQKVVHNSKGSELEEWNHNGQTSNIPSIHYGVTPAGKQIIYHSGRDDYSVIILNMKQLKGDLS